MAGHNCLGGTARFASAGLLAANVAPAPPDDAEIDASLSKCVHLQLHPIIHHHDERTVRISAYRATAILAASVALAACAASPFTPQSATPSDPASGAQPSQNILGMENSPAPAAATADKGVTQRELTPAEKKVIVNAIAPSLRDPGAAKYRWAKIRYAADGQVSYCATVNAKSPYAAYSGQQAYIVEATVSGGKISSAVVGLIAGGKDIEIVRTMCQKRDLDPNDAT